MGISMIYVAPSDGPVDGCGPLPVDAHSFTTPLPHRTSPPRFIVPIVGIGPDGRARDISAPPGATSNLADNATIGVRNYFFSRPNVRVKRGTTLNWAFAGGTSAIHNVTVASGPRGFGSPNHSDSRFSYRFKVRGKYRIFCALHPVSMTEVVTVK
jgi:plastocyanin